METIPLCMNPIPFVSCSVDGQLSSFHHLAIVNNYVIAFGIHVALWMVDLEAGREISEVSVNVL